MTWEVRKPLINESKAIWALHRDTVQRVNRRDYSPEHIATWLGGRRDEIPQKAIDDHWWVCSDSAGNLHGLGTYAENRVTGLYVDANQLGQGIGRAILARMEEKIRKRGASEILVESTLTAASFYRRMGYEETGRGHVGPAKLEVVNLRKLVSPLSQSAHS